MQIINNLGANAHFKQLRDQFESAGWALDRLVPGDSRNDGIAFA